MADVKGYELKYEDLPKKRYKIIKATRKGGKGSKMSKELKTAKVRKSYSKTRTEHMKDIVITILVTAILAFIAGAMFQNNQHDVVENALNAVTPTASAETLKQ